MFKNLTVYLIPDHVQIAEGDDLIDALHADRFTPCGASQEKSAGWIPPRPGGDALAESQSGHTVLCYCVETKSVPSQMVKRRLAEEVAKIEKETGRTPGRKEKKDLKEDVVRMLLPQAFPKTASTRVWIDRDRNRVMIDSTSKGRTDEILTALVKSLEGFEVNALNTKESPQGVMAVWLSDVEDMPQGFGFGRKVELQATDEEKSAVKFDRHVLECDQVRIQLKQGKAPMKLELEWQDRVSFLFNNAGQIKGIRLLDSAEAPDGEDDPFDADMAIYTNEVSQMLDELIEACGGCEV